MTDSDDVELPGEWEDDDRTEPGPRRGRRAALSALAAVGVLVLGLGLVIGNYLNGLQNCYQKRTVVQITRGASGGGRPAEIDGTRRNMLLVGCARRSPGDGG